jgi:hypothetical protein
MTIAANEIRLAAVGHIDGIRAPKIQPDFFAWRQMR